MYFADVKSGVSGAGCKAELATLMSETGESFKAYAVGGYRHLPEISQGLELLGGPKIGLLDYCRTCKMILYQLSLIMKFITFYAQLCSISLGWLLGKLNWG